MFYRIIHAPEFIMHLFASTVFLKATQNCFSLSGRSRMALYSPFISNVDVTLSSNANNFMTLW